MWPSSLTSIICWRHCFIYLFFWCLCLTSLSTTRYSWVYGFMSWSLIWLYDQRVRVQKSCFVPIPCCFCYCNPVLQFELGMLKPISCSPFIIEYYFSYPVLWLLLFFHMKLRVENWPFKICEELYSSFEGDCPEYVCILLLIRWPFLLC